MSDNDSIDEHIFSKFQVIKKLGSGAYGHVLKVAPHDKSTQIYALKKVFEAFQHDTDASVSTARSHSSKSSTTIA